MSNVAGPVSSSSMISLQRSMHSSQMYTPGPAMSFLTCRCDLPQKLQRSCSLPSLALATTSPFTPKVPVPLGPVDDHAVDDAVVLRLVGRHEVVAIHVAGDLLEVLSGVVGHDLLELALERDRLASVDLDVGRL